MRKILIISGRYLPGYKDGGPVRTIKNLVDHLGEEYEFHILTCDRDHGDLKPYQGITVHGWNKVGNAKVYYVPPKGFKFRLICNLAKEADLIYVCGCYSDYSIKTLILKRLNFIRKPLVIASMGLFMPNAMKKKPLKYNTFLYIFKTLGMFKAVIWSTSSKSESECVRRVISSNSICYIAEDLPRKIEIKQVNKSKEKGRLRVFFISRISPEKNIEQSIEILKKCKGSITYTIYGPIHNSDYWDYIQKKLLDLPKNIEAVYGGEIESERVVELLKKEHVFLFTTIGENYSHVVHEALSAGCPCVISDQTRWQDLSEKGVGYVYSLQNNDLFVKAIESYIDMSEVEFQSVVKKASEYALNISKGQTRETGYRKILEIRE